MNKYQKQIGKKIIVKNLNEIVIRKDGKVIYAPTEEMVLLDGWVEYVPPVTPEPTEEELLEKARTRIIRRIEEYDSSDKVNVCHIRKDGARIDYWANKTDRDTLKGVVRDYISLGKEEYRLDLRELGIYITISCELLLGMLAQLEVYAAECYNKTSDHIYAINQLTTVEEIENYDYTTGYPEKLTFEL